jgi:IS5 family transposase
MTLSFWHRWMRGMASATEESRSLNRLMRRAVGLPDENTEPHKSSIVKTQTVIRRMKLQSDSVKIIRQCQSDNE